MTDERIRALERSVAHAPADATARLSLARELARAGRRDDARGHVSQVLRAEPLSVDAVRTLDDLGFGPLAHDAPWPTSEGGNDRARRSSQPGARRGELVKRVRIGREGETARSVTASASTVYVASSSSRLIALDLERGAPRWIRDFQTLVEAPAIGEGERLLVVADGALQLLDGARGGETLWSLRVREERPFFTLAPRGLALVAGGDLLEAVDVATGKVRWRFKAPGSIDACPVVDANAIFVATNGSIEVVELDGKLGTRLRMPQAAPRKLALTERALYVQATGLHFIVRREGRSLGPKKLLDGEARGYVCAIDSDTFFKAGGGAPTTFVSFSSDNPTSESFGGPAIADSAACIFAAAPDGVVWLDSTGARVKNVLSGANNLGLMAIGPASTLLVASVRGILHVIA